MFPFLIKLSCQLGHRLVYVVFWVYLPGKKLVKRWGNIEGKNENLIQLIFGVRCHRISVLLIVFYQAYTWDQTLDLTFMQAGFQRLKGFPQPFWLALFVEGTRFTEAKLKAAQEYAASAGLPKPRNLLIPRTKVTKMVTWNLISRRRKKENNSLWNAKWPEKVKKMKFVHSMFLIRHNDQLKAKIEAHPWYLPHSILYIEWITIAWR
mgnify:CR=1 FL=1